MHTATLNAMDAIDAAQWDAHPIREVLVSLLGGHAFVRGDIERELAEAEGAGILEFRYRTDEEMQTLAAWAAPPVLPVWSVKGTVAGRQLALRISHSPELCSIIDTAGNVSDAKWTGIDLRVVFNELDLRDGGAGQVNDWEAWGQSRGRAYICDLPRRGLDAQDTPN